MSGYKASVIDFPKTLDERFAELIALDESGSTLSALEGAKKLIDEGKPEAYTLAGFLYERGGNGLEVDYDNALFYYHKSIEEVGMVSSYLALGRMYYYGKGVKPDYEAAFEYYDLVREDNEHQISYLMLGRMYKNGEFVEKDFDKAEEYFNKAYEGGNIWGLTCLGFLEKERGNFIKGLIIRLKAGAKAFKRARSGDNDESWYRQC